MNIILKKTLPHFIAIIILLIVSCLAFYPQLSGKTIVAGDIVNSDAKTKHIKDYMESDEDLLYWNSAQFSGGPIFLLSLGKKNNLLRYIDKAITFNHRAPIGMFFGLSLIMYFSLVALNLRPSLALIFSIAHMFSLIHLTLLEAGHFSKVYTLGYLPLIIAGLIIVFRKKYILGGILFTLGLSLSIYSGHVQMIYYLALALVFFPIPFIASYIKNKDFTALYKGIGVLVLGVSLGVFSNFSQLYSSLVFSEKTMRGGDILQQENAAANTEDSEDGLDWEYAMNWSYEIKDFGNILIPRIVGGGSQEMVDKENPIAKLMIQNKAAVKNGKVAIPGYWSSMPFTSGSAYIGASLFFLFILGLSLIDKRIAISSVIAFLVIFLLSLGENAGFSFGGMEFNINKFLYHNLPMFDKFRAPSSAVSILPPFIIIVAALGVHHLIKFKEEKLIFKKFLIGSAISAGILGLIWIIGTSSFDFLSQNDLSYDFNIQQILIDGRKQMFSDDVYRSFLFMLAIFGLTVLLLKNILKKEILLVIGLGLLFCLDLVPISRRYFSEDNFQTKTKYATNFVASPASAQITQLEPKGRGYYRVLDLTTNTFNDAKPSYHHNQIGGYDPTKLQRYQDLIDYHIGGSIQSISGGLQNIKTQEDLNQLLAQQPVLNMLNCKYIIVNPNSAPIVNQNAMKNAWFVNNIEYVETNQTEIEKIKQVDIKTTAIINQQEFGSTFKTGNGSGSIELISYAPNKLVYQTNTASDQLAVFSEVWYGGDPDWVATIDDQEASIFRSNYILKSMQIPAGQHEIVLEFSPKGKGVLVSLFASILIWIGIIWFSVLYFKKETEAKVVSTTTK